MAESRMVASVLWRRLDASGSDTARLIREENGWLLAGTAAFLEGGKIAHLRYQVKCNKQWHSERGWISGYIGNAPLELEVVASPAKEWTLNGKLIPEVTGCVDLDLNFTPATNLIQFRRLALAVGARVEAPAAWFMVPEFKLCTLRQTLLRTSQMSYDYAAPTVGYSGVLTVHATGFVLHYPELWVAEKVESYSEWWERDSV